MQILKSMKLKIHGVLGRTVPVGFEAPAFPRDHMRRRHSSHMVTGQLAEGGLGRYALFLDVYNYIKIKM